MSQQEEDDLEDEYNSARGIDQNSTQSNLIGKEPKTTPLQLRAAIALSACAHKITLCLRLYNLLPYVIKVSSKLHVSKCKP